MFNNNNMSKPSKWFVWNPNGRAPQFQHDDEPSAHREAERLALLHPGQEFHVLVSVGSCVKESVTWFKHESDTLPF